MNTVRQVEARRLQRLGLSAREVAELLGISTRQVWWLTAAGELPKPARVGMRARWDRQALVEWWQAQQDGWR